MTVTQTERTQTSPVSRTAEIIAFPARSPAPPVLLPQERLARALASLNTALAEQSAAVAAWHRTLTDLKASAVGLGGSLELYRDSLASLGQGVSDLQTQAHALRNWADRAAASQG